MILVTVTLLIPLISFQIGEASYRYLKEYQNSSTKIISTTILFLLFNLTVFLLVALFLYYFLEWNEILWFVVICASSFMLHNLLLIYRGLNLIKSYALLGSLSGAFTLFFIVFVLLHSPTILNISICFGIGHFIAIAISLWESSILYKIKLLSWNKTLLLRLFFYSLPLIPNAISWWLIDLGNRYIIKFTIGEEANGIYAVAARYIVLIAFLNSFFLLIWQDKYLENKLTEGKLKHKLSNFVKLQLSIVLFVFAISYYLISFGAGNEFMEAYKLVGPIAFSLFLSSLSAFVGVEFLKKKNTKLLFYSTLIGGGVNLICSLCLVNFIGLYAIALGSLLGFLSTLILRLRKSIEIKGQLESCKRKIILGSLIMLFVYIVQLSEKAFLIIPSLVVIFIGLLLWNKNTLIKILK